MVETPLLTPPSNPRVHVIPTNNKPPNLSLASLSKRSRDPTRETTAEASNTPSFPVASAAAAAVFNGRDGVALSWRLRAAISLCALARRTASFTTYQKKHIFFSL